MESRAPWRASQARLAVREGHGPTEKWLEAMRGRMDALMAVIDAAEDLRMARLDWRRAVGPPPVEPVMEGSR